MRKIIFIFFIAVCFVNKNFSQESRNVTPEPIFTVVEEMPEFPGGEEARIKFITENLKFKKGLGECVNKKIYISFIIEKDGKISTVSVYRPTGCKETEEKVIRVVKSMPDWKPGKQAGKTVRVQFLMPVYLE